MNSLEKLFAAKKTENGDDAFNTTGDKLLDLLFMSEYYSKHLDEVEIDKGGLEVLFMISIVTEIRLRLICSLINLKR